MNGLRYTALAVVLAAILAPPAQVWTASCFGWFGEPI